MALFQEDDNFFGLDLGASSVKLVQLKNIHGKPSLLTYGDIEVPFGLLSSDSPVDLDKLSDIIRKLSGDAKVSTKNVVAALPASFGYAAVITTPKLSHDELASSIRFQADKYIPMPIDQVKLDYTVLGPKGNGETDEQEVLLVAAPTTLANKYLGIIQKAGLELMALEVNAIAEARALMPPQSTTAVIVDIGSIATDLAVVNNQVPRLIRSLNIGSRSITRVVGQNLGLAQDQAEQFVKKFGMSQAKLEAQVYKAVKPLADNLADEIKKSIQFFQEHNAMKVEKIILTGGTSALLDLPPYLANATGVTVEIGNPWVNVSYPHELEPKLSSISLNYSGAVGLAMRGMG